ncbi:GTPase [Flagellimonas onchidii]|uniref:GTPase n=1 Tax=Flagellimonas onchidii TaxID=2562684 RepID=UPI0010A62A6E|nr:GTPase [Allomuricauda onchidii]
MIKKNLTKLIFVYNANSGVRNAILDSMHKVFSPSTYECNLCDITFGIVSENKIWKEFRQNSELDMEFLHKDEFAGKYGSERKKEFVFPIALKEEGGTLNVLVSAEKINKLKTAQELIALIREKTNEV